VALDLSPATDRVAQVVRYVPDDALDAPTPSDINVGDLLDHLQTLAAAFAAAAAKQGPGGQPPTPSAANLGDDWRETIPGALARLADAWNRPDAWEGMTKVGGLEMPGEAAGVVALDEVVLHGWDLARATGQDFDVPSEVLDGLMGFLTHMAEPGMEPAREGLFGPVVEVPAGAPLLHRVLGLAGRNPDW
jgi:uncharacterized protein (TIGR03086 family)